MSKKRLKGSVFVVLAIVAILVLAGCDEPEKTVQYYMDEYDGIPEVYEEILATTNCGTLRARFLVSVDNNDRQTPGTSLFRVTLGYMAAIDDQMEKVGCYD